MRLVDQHCPTRLMMENDHVVLTLYVAAGCRWTIDWIIRPKTGGQFRGQLTFDTELFSRAFLMKDDTSDWRADATAYQRGMFIRYGRYLSIPGPGNGEDSDPNCCVFIDQLIELALKQYFERTCPCALA